MYASLFYNRLNKPWVYFIGAELSTVLFVYVLDWSGANHEVSSFIEEDPVRTAFIYMAALLVFYGLTKNGMGLNQEQSEIGSQVSTYDSDEEDTNMQALTMGIWDEPISSDDKLIYQPQ